MAAAVPRPAASFAPPQSAAALLVMRQLGVCVLYAGSSVALSMTNKWLLTSFDFDAVFCMLLAQLLLSLAVCVVSRDVLAGNPLSVPAYAGGAALREVAPLGTAYVLNVGLGLVALKIVNVPMFFALRRLIAPMILAYEFAALGRVAPPRIRGAVALIVAGTLLAGWGALRADLAGYALTLACNVLTAATTVMQKQVADRRKLSVFGVMYVNALVAAPLAAALALATGEPARFAASPHALSPAFWAAFVGTAVMGIVLTYASILSTTYLSPLATCITGNAKDVATTAIGWVAFAGFSPTPNAVAGIGLSLVGAAAYSYTNVVEQSRAMQEKQLRDKDAGALAAAATAGAAGAAAAAVAAAAAAPDGDDARGDAEAALGGGGQLLDGGKDAAAAAAAAAHHRAARAEAPAPAPADIRDV